MDLLIVGAGGMGREIFSWLSHDIKNKSDLCIKGFLDDDRDALAKYSYPVKILGTISRYEPKKNETLVMAIADPKIKKKVVAKLQKRGAKFYTLIHPSAIIGENNKIGQGCIIAPYCIITNDCRIGDFVFINCNSSIGHDVIIDDYTSIHGKVEITGKVQIGTSCLLGTGAKIIPSCKIGDDVKVGAGSTVITNIANSSSVFGNPAKLIDQKQKKARDDDSEKIKEIFASVLQIPLNIIEDSLSPATLTQWHSQNHLLLIAAFEERFSLDIEPEEIPLTRESYGKFKSVILEKIRMTQ